jgi:TorA maturation chaperone TorD
MPHDEQGKDAARADLCRFLAACYYEPGPEFAEEKVFDSMLAAATRIAPDLAVSARHVGSAFSAADPESLLVDYTRLFLGPVDARAKPYGSAWLGKQDGLMRESTIAVQQLYHEGGFDISEDFRELPDHVAAELEFLYLLIYRENQARRVGDTKSLARIAAVRKRFLDEHLGAWIGAFTAAVQAGAESAFYRELADLTDRVVKMEAKGQGPAQTR